MKRPMLIRRLTGGALIVLLTIVAGCATAPENRNDNQAAPQPVPTAPKIVTVTQAVPPPAIQQTAHFWVDVTTTAAGTANVSYSVKKPAPGVTLSNNDKTTIYINFKADKSEKEIRFFIKGGRFEPNSQRIAPRDNSVSSPKEDPSDPSQGYFTVTAGGTKNTKSLKHSYSVSLKGKTYLIDPIIEIQDN